ncbi:unnamed protein product [Vicia faba]|uniref:Uncharacterized protein n=1 Tax=Vicia faba TaxID=3906 RepID=A0AAV1BB45_VICFA|nr:unnamed protein product [Vicia faba]
MMLQTSQSPRFASFKFQLLHDSVSALRLKLILRGFLSISQLILWSYENIQRNQSEQDSKITLEESGVYLPTGGKSDAFFKFGKRISNTEIDESMRLDYSRNEDDTER